jgi:hypothetical protein
MTPCKVNEEFEDFIKRKKKEFQEFVTPEGGIKRAGLSKFLEKIQTDPVYTELLGKQNKELISKLKIEVKNFQSVVDNVAASEKFYANPSQTAYVIKNGEFIRNGGVALVSLLTGSPWPLVGYAGTSGLANRMAAFFTSPAFKQELLHQFDEYAKLKSLPISERLIKSNAIKNTVRSMVASGVAKKPEKKKFHQSDEAKDRDL